MQRLILFKLKTSRSLLLACKGYVQLDIVASIFPYSLHSQTIYHNLTLHRVLI